MRRDFAFKLLFGSPEHTRITIHFLNSILGGECRLTRITFLNPILGKEMEDDKISILDILAVDERGRYINIEIQTTIPAGMRQRLVYYVSRLYTDQLGVGEKYTSLRPAISICLLAKPMFPEDSRLHLDFRLRESSGLIMTDDLQIHLLQLPNLRVTVENLSDASPIERWCYFLLSADKLTAEEIRQMFPEDEFSEAAGVLEMISKNPEQRQQYEARLKLQRDEAARLDAAVEEGLNTGIALGIEQGFEQGREKGIEEGEIIGRIRLLEELLSVSPHTLRELKAFNQNELTHLEEDLKRRLRSRG